MATNADPAVDDSENVSEEEKLRREKAALDDVDPSNEEDENGEDDDSTDDSDDTGEDDDQIDDDANDEDSEDDANADSDDEDSGFVKEFDNIKGDTLEDYARSLEEAYRNSTSEAVRLKKENDELKAGNTSIGADTGVDDDDDSGAAKVDTTDPVSLYMKQKMDEEITSAYTEFSKDYSQVNDSAEYQKFLRTVKTLGKTIYEDEGRVAPPRELYSKAAVILEWTPKETKPSDKERVGMALKGRAAISKSSAGPKKPGPKSKVTQAMIDVNRKMYPGKTDAEIRAELEPHIQ